MTIHPNGLKTSIKKMQTKKLEGELTMNRLFKIDEKNYMIR